MHACKTSVYSATDALLHLPRHLPMQEQADLDAGPALSDRQLWDWMSGRLRTQVAARKHKRGALMMHGLHCNGCMQGQVSFAGLTGWQRWLKSGGPTQMGRERAQQQHWDMGAYASSAGRGQPRAQRRWSWSWAQVGYSLHAVAKIEPAPLPPPSTADLGNSDRADSTPCTQKRGVPHLPLPQQPVCPPTGSR